VKSMTGPDTGNRSDTVSFPGLKEPLSTSLTAGRSASLGVFPGSQFCIVACTEMLSFLDL
jgi:hypothetical protein